jgi:hypothetical protein
MDTVGASGRLPLAIGPTVSKIPIFLEPANPLHDDLDAWAERVVARIEAAITALKAEDAPIDEKPKPADY